MLKLVGTRHGKTRYTCLSPAADVPDQERMILTLALFPRPISVHHVHLDKYFHFAFTILAVSIL